ncbi:MAG TPA: cytochrome c oxidase subunit II [Methylosinus sp.]
MIFAAGLAAGCRGPLSTLDAAGPTAASIAQIWWLMLAGAVCLWILVMALLLLRAPKSERGLLWGGGLLLPAIVLVPLLAHALRLGERLLPLPDRANVEVVRVEARQFAWAFVYGDGNVARRSDGVMHLPVGRPVDVLVTSRDVIHSFWIPRLGGKIDAVPGHATIMRVQVDAPGSYQGQCGEFCGAGHAMMRFVARAHLEPDYVAAIRALPIDEPGREP